MTTPFTITIRHDPDAGVLTATSVDRSSRQLLEQAGLVRHDATGLYRPRRDTSPFTAQRLVVDATRLLTACGYDVLRLYSEQERREQVFADATATPVMTRRPGTIWGHHVSDDWAAGHLDVHARLSRSDGPTAFLVAYPALGDAAVLATETDAYFGVTVYGTLDEARAALGIAPQEAPEPTDRPSVATARTAPAAPAPTVPEPAPARHAEAIAGRSR